MPCVYYLVNFWLGFLGRKKRRNYLSWISNFQKYIDQNPIGFLSCLGLFPPDGVACICPTCRGKLDFWWGLLKQNFRFSFGMPFVFKGFEACFYAFSEKFKKNFSRVPFLVVVSCVMVPLLG